MTQSQESSIPIFAAPHPAEIEGHEASPLLQAARERHAALSGLLAKPEASLADPDYIHDVRVASRRIGEVARLVARAGTLLDKPAAKAVEAGMQALRRSMGDLRDADVTTEHLLKWRMPAPLKKLARELAAEHALRRPILEKAAGTQVRSTSLTGAMLILARILEPPPATVRAVEKRLQSTLKSMLKKRDKQVRQAFGKAARKQTPVSLHDARISVKKLRYLLELSETFTPGADRKVRDLKKIQQLLGDHHDAHVIAAQLESHLESPTQLAKNLTPAWHAWHRDIQREQAHRAATFFMKSYLWMNT